MEKFYKGFVSYKSLTKIGLMAFLFCIAVSSAIAQPMNGAFTINRSASASTTNFISFQAFFTALSSRTVNGAVTVSVLNGPYTEQVTANAITGVSATNTITINGNNQILQFNATSSATRHTLLFNGADRVTINNLDIRGTGSSFAFVVRLANLSEFITLDGCRITTPNLTGLSTANSALIVASGSATSSTTTGNNVRNFTVRNCTLSGGTSVGPSYGIIIYESSTTVDNIKIHNNVYQNISYMYNRFFFCDEIEVFDNDMSHLTGFSNITTTYGIYANQCGRMYIRRNKIHDFFPSSTAVFYGMLLTSNPSSNGSDITNNVLYNNFIKSTTYGIYNASSPGVNILHNTISFDNQSYNYNGTTYCLFQTGTASGQVRNNVISFTTPGTGGTRYGIYHGGAVSTINNNCVYLNSTGATNYYGYTTSGNHLNLSAWQNATGNGAPFGQNDVDANPMFVNPLIGNLTPRSIAVDDIGAPMGVTTDLANNARSTTNPDPGAYEFNIDANVSRLVLPGVNNCEKQVETINVWVRNNSAITISGFNMQYRVNGANTVTQPYTGSILPGDSAQFTFATKYTYNTAGSFVFESRILGKPWVGPYTVNVNAAPLGSEIVRGSTFNGTFNSGNVADPDIIANPDEVNFELTVPTAPSGFTNSNYGTAWYISKLTASTINGTPIPSSDTASFAPAGGQNARLRYRPSGSFTDSTVRFTVQVYSTTTQCFAPDLQRVIFIAPRPKAGFTATDVCDGESMEMFNTSTISTGGMEFNWTFGDGTTSPNGDNLKTYSAAGSYNVKMIVTSNYGYKDSVTKTVNVWQAPVVNFTAVNQCEGTPVAFTNTSAVPNGTPVYSWNFGDGVGTSANANPTYTYSNTQLYMVTLSVKDAKGCIRSESKPVTYSKSPKADFTFPASVCNLKDIPFTNISVPEGTTGYTWDFGDGTKANDFAPMHNYNASGNFTINLVAKNEFGCTSTSTKQITLKESPAINYTISTQCAGEPATFTNNTTEPAGSTVGYTWEFGDGSTSSTKNAVHTFTGIGDYEVKLIATASNGCASEKSGSLSFRERPRANFSIPEKACVNQAVSILNNSDVSTGTLTYSWNLGNGTSAAVNPNNTYTSAGTFTVKLIASSVQGCDDSAIKTIIVNPVSNTEFTSASAQTGDGSILFTPTTQNGAGVYTWTYGDGSKSNQKGAHSYKYIGLGIFKVTLNINNDGCASSTTKDVVINITGIEDAANTLPMNVYPNPSNGNFTVDFGTETNANVKVTDIAGRVVATFAANEVVNGKLNISLGDIAAGVYVVQAESAQKAAVVKITVTK